MAVKKSFVFGPTRRATRRTRPDDADDSTDLSSLVTLGGGRGGVTPLGNAVGGGGFCMGFCELPGWCACRASAACGVRLAYSIASHSFSLGMGRLALGLLVLLGGRFASDSHIPFLFLVPGQVPTRRY